MEIYTVAFFGHRYIDNSAGIEGRLEQHIRRLLSGGRCVEFLVGRNGVFDQFCCSAVRRVRSQYRDDNSALILVLPYITAAYRNNREYYENYYSEIEISEGASRVHPKAAIGIRNREMVDRADLIICYVDRQNGGAYEAMQYAIRQGKPTINLAEETNR